MLFNDGAMCLHLVPAFPAFSNPSVPFKVAVINMDPAKSLDGKIKCCSGSPSFPTQHQATDSCLSILCTKCHLSYYKFSAEYSADPMGLRTKREHWQGHLWNAKRELPQSVGCEAVLWLLRLWVDTDGCNHPPCLTKMIAGVFFCIQYGQHPILNVDLWFIRLKDVVCLTGWHQRTFNF